MLGSCSPPTVILNEWRFLYYSDDIPTHVCRRLIKKNYQQQLQEFIMAWPSVKHFNYPSQTSQEVMFIPQPWACHCVMLTYWMINMHPLHNNVVSVRRLWSYIERERERENEFVLYWQTHATSNSHSDVLKVLRSTMKSELQISCKIIMVLFLVMWLEFIFSTANLPSDSLPKKVILATADSCNAKDTTKNCYWYQT